MLKLQNDSFCLPYQQDTTQYNSRNTQSLHLPQNTTRASRIYAWKGHTRTYTEHTKIIEMLRQLNTTYERNTSAQVKIKVEHRQFHSWNIVPGYIKEYDKAAFFRLFCLIQMENGLFAKSQVTELGICVGGKERSNLRYADDSTFLGNTEDELD